MSTLKTWRVTVMIVLCAVSVAIVASAYRSSVPLSVVAEAQDVSNLDRRIGNLEQRLYSIESSISRLNQGAAISQRPASPSASGREAETNLLRSEIEVLRRRLGEIECGLIKLDERIASPGERRNSVEANAIDPCRLNANLPLRLSTRP